MKHTTYLLLVILAITTSAARAEKGKTDVLRGGTGFLFADANNFSNAGQSALNKGATFETLYSQASVSGITAYRAKPSFAYSSGSFFIGGFADRVGTSLTTSGSFATRGGGQLGVAMAKGKITLGGGYTTDLESLAGTTNDKVWNASLNFNGGSKGKGVVLGVGIDLHNADTNYKAPKVALGYSFRRGASIEANATFTDFNSSTVVYGGHFNLNEKAVYVGAGYEYAQSTATSSMSGRAGVVFGAMDLAFTTSIPLQATTNAVYGGALRFAF